MQVAESFLLSSECGVTVIAVPFFAVELQFMGEPLTARWKHFIWGSALCIRADIRPQVLEDVMPMELKY